MTPAKKTYIFISLLAISLLPACAQKKMVKTEPAVADSSAFISNVAVSVDLAGAVQRWVSTYGQYEAALRLNIKGRYFPIIELGIGQADNEDDVTHIRYKTSAPFGRIGIDFNLLKNKHDAYRFYVGARYGYTSFKYDLEPIIITDPSWGGETTYQTSDVKCYYHWMEAVAGIDVKIARPIRLGWSIRYRKRIAHDHNPVGDPWYVPGYGRGDSSHLAGTFNLIVEF